MGFIFSRPVRQSRGVGVPLSPELADSLVSEEVALRATHLLVPDCPLCHSRLCFVKKAEAGLIAAALSQGKGNLTTDAADQEGGWHMSGAAPAASAARENYMKPLQCSNCHFKTQVQHVEVLSTGNSDRASILLSRLPTVSFRKHSVVVASLYSSGIHAGDMLTKKLGQRFAMHVSRVQLRRSNLASDFDADQLPWPADLCVLVHWCEGQRNPIVDMKGLYSRFVAGAWDLLRGSIVIVLANVASSAYLEQMAEEQPTLKTIASCRRLVVLFKEGDIGHCQFASGALCLGGGLPQVETWRDLLTRHQQLPDDLRMTEFFPRAAKTSSGPNSPHVHGWDSSELCSSISSSQL